MKIPFVDLKKQFLSLKEEMDRAIASVFEESWFILGKNVASFEEEFASYCGVKYAIGVGSGTEALHLALIACGVTAGDEVITVPNTAVPTVSAISLAHAIPVFIDIEEDTFNMDPEQLRGFLENKCETSKKDQQVINKKTGRRIAAIIPVHLYGHPAEMDSIMTLAKTFGLCVIEDACQAHGAQYKGKKVGAIGDVGCFSFYPSKNLGAYGDGGMALTSNRLIADKLRMLRNYGQTSRYHHQVKGFNSRLDEIQAAILRVKLRKLDKWDKARRERAFWYNEFLSGTDFLTPIEKEYGYHVYHLYVIRHKLRDKLREYLQKKGIFTQIHYPIPVHLQGAYSDLDLKEGKFPITERCSKEVLSLPMYPELEREKVEEVTMRIKEWTSLGN